MFFYFIFVHFRLFPVFDFGLAHYGSEPFKSFKFWYRIQKRVTIISEIVETETWTEFVLAKEFWWKGDLFYWFNFCAVQL